MWSAFPFVSARRPRAAKRYRRGSTRSLLLGLCLCGILKIHEAHTMLEAKPLDVSVFSMPTVVFTGDSQTCGRNLAIDYPQLLSRVLPARVINTGVGGSNSSALLRPMTGGHLRVRAGDRVVYGEHVRWGMGPFPGMHITIHGNTYTIDSIREHPRTPRTEIVLTGPAIEGYEGEDYAIEPGWFERVAKYRPSVVTLMYINDGAMPPAKQDDWREMIRRIRGLGAVPVLMSPFPIDGEDTGGSHPGDNRPYARNAAAVRALAAAEGCWFVDVFHLMFALDPSLRGVNHDGIHPDTDGQTAAMDGLLWVFEQMGLLAARPYIRGWVATAALPGALASGGERRPFRTAQPDHPDPNRQVTDEFTIDALRRNDEYGLIAAADGQSLAFSHGLLFEVGLEPGVSPGSLRLAAIGKGLDQAYARQGGDDGGWLVMKRVPAAAGEAVQAWTFPTGALAADGVLRFALAAGSGGGHLDWLALRRETGAPPSRWQPKPVAPRAYALTSDHARAGNLVSNPAFLEGEKGWHFSGDVRVNRPFAASLGCLAFPDPDDLRVALVENPGRVRPFDRLAITGSRKDNNGTYCVRAVLDGGRLALRRRAAVVEDGLRAVVHHDDGCGLVAGHVCAELGPGAAVGRTLVLPEKTGELALSFFYRVYAPDRLGTRDVPAAAVRVTLESPDANGGVRVREFAKSCSYQWRKAETVFPLEPGIRSARFTIAVEPATVLQLTGVYAGPPLTRP